MWFGLAAIALAGAAALLYIDQLQRRRTGRVRAQWAKSHGDAYTAHDDHLPATWNRATMAKQDYLPAIDIVNGVRRGEQFVMFDLEENATIIAVRRESASAVDLDLRLKTMAPPREPDLELLGAIGSRLIFATDLEVARRVCDQRMVRFAEGLPDWVQVLWTEGQWTLGSIPVTVTSKDWYEAIEAVTRLSAILHALPPVIEPEFLDTYDHDPGRPYPHFVPGEETAPKDPDSEDPTVAFGEVSAGAGPVSEPRRQRHPEQGPPPQL
ncbi:hypothetical protein OG921_02230 [Aldersonia sp. NBC_00410]|uniref:hypothetical protein n=1 Tax=Aldersonia sp. NBC_00410 TaxID=2975954 RepID=UPI002251CE00|nr:hypothetical protein [Aldersonia sp. NBC_00410]MCX5042012.1 hypothetical protein [Aldersonia sp. NBC_00410]